MDNNITRKITQDNFTTEKIDVIKNTLLGDYDDNGHYFIAPQIINELLDLKKHRKSSFGNSIFCVGRLLGYGEIVFELAFNKKTKAGEQASAKLYVLENVDKINGYLQNTIKTKIAEFSSDVDNFIEEAFEHFRITNSEVDDEGKERKLIDDLNNEDSFILAKKQYSLLLEKLTEEKFLDAYGKYFTFRISALTKLDNEFANAVLDKFNEEYALIESVFLDEKNYKVLNELLDKCIESVSGLNPTFIEQEKDFNEKTAPALETFIASVDRLNERFGNKALNMLDKDDRIKVEEIKEAENNSLEQNELNSNNADNNEGDGEKTIENNIIEELAVDNSNIKIEEIPVIPSIDEEKEEQEEKEAEEQETKTETEQNNTKEEIQESQTFKDIRDYFEREKEIKTLDKLETKDDTKDIQKDETKEKPKVEEEVSTKSYKTELTVPKAEKTEEITIKPNWYEQKPSREVYNETSNKYERTITEARQDNSLEGKLPKEERKSEPVIEQTNKETKPAVKFFRELEKKENPHNNTEDVLNKNYMPDSGTPRPSILERLQELTKTTSEGESSLITKETSKVENISTPIDMYPSVDHKTINEEPLVNETLNNGQVPGTPANSVEPLVQQQPSVEPSSEPRDNEKPDNVLDKKDTLRDVNKFPADLGDYYINDSGKSDQDLLTQVGKYDDYHSKNPEKGM